MDKGKVNGTGVITGYDIKQELEGEGQMTINLTFINFGGDCKTYSDFLDDFKVFLKSRKST